MSSMLVPTNIDREGGHTREELIKIKFGLLEILFLT